MDNNTIFASYFDANGDIKKISMSEIEGLLCDEKNKDKIADWVYYRLFERFLKPFFFDENPKLNDNPELIKIFQLQYKHGFAIMTNCCLLIETLASFLSGANKTNNKGDGVNSYKLVFQKAKDYGNDLKEFGEIKLYGAVRCGLLHQGETYDSFIIRREGNILHSDKKTINATAFAKALRGFLQKYQRELKSSDCRWDGELWDNCRRKIRFIIKNSSKK